MLFCAQLLEKAKAARNTISPALSNDVVPIQPSIGTMNAQTPGAESNDTDNNDVVGPTATLASNNDVEEPRGDPDALNDGLRWEDGAVRLLLAEFKSKEDLHNSGKISVKFFWEMVSARMLDKGYLITGPQCKSKFNGLKKTYKSVKDHNRKSGNSRLTWQYYEVMDELFGNKPWVHPTVTLDLATPIPSQSLSPSLLSPTSSRSNSPAVAKGSCKRQKVSRESAVETLNATLNQSREEMRKMHEEAMARQDRLLALLEKISEK